MELTDNFYNVSGFGIDDCCFLCQRFRTDVGFRPDRGECWVLRSTTPPPGKLGLSVAYSVTGWFTGMWRSPESAYVTELYGRIHVCRDLDSIIDKNTWIHVDFKGVIMDGVWGLDDQCVFVWGARKLKPLMLFWDGNAWTELPPPPDEVAGMHGIAPDLVYAVGRNGLIARWDGKAWKRASVPTQEFLISVFVASADEMYAVGHGGVLWEGSSNGWGKAADGPGSVLQGVAKFGNDVWVGGQVKGLLRRKGNKLVVANADLHVNSIDARKALLVTTNDEIAETKDGKKFKKKAKGIMTLARKDKILWNEGDDE